MKTLTLQNNAQANIKVLAVDNVGLPIAVPAAGTAASSDTTLFTASVGTDGSVEVTAIAGAAGTGTLTYTNGTLSDEATVVIAAPTVASVSLDVADAVISAQPQPVKASS